eukprot:TRINITY_DN1063_c0_g1_i5.p1 TRINITY_DN1063_c0_g1~~TRINITY_DN1063_c0_g1_i5.p1  ORF type:complete len:375 (-),score=79.87 TRINITY_DN1063_c0_g1_i5:316-1440(-)
MTDSLHSAQHLDLRDYHLHCCLQDMQLNVADGEFAIGGFLSEEYAIRRWAQQLVTKSSDHTFQAYVLDNAYYLNVQDRYTGQVIQEKVPFYLKSFMLLAYQSRVGRAAFHFDKLYARLTRRFGERYNHPSSRSAIPPFIRYHNIDMSLFQDDVDSFATFNDFFYRKLRPGARPIAYPDDPTIAISPADCRLTVFNSIAESKQIWIKGRSFDLEHLLVHPELIERWKDASLALCRLAPQDYHRFHVPFPCRIGRSYDYPGLYNSVNPLAIRSARDILTENRRVLTILEDTPFGPQVLFIAVGACLVGSCVLTSREGAVVPKAHEHGYFAFGGSTILLLFQRNTIAFDHDLPRNSANSLETYIHMGDTLGRLIRPA